MQPNSPFRTLCFTYFPDHCQHPLPSNRKITFTGPELTGTATDPDSIAKPEMAALAFAKYCEGKYRQWKPGYVRVDAIRNGDDYGFLRQALGELWFEKGEWTWQPWQPGHTPNPLIHAIAACAALSEQVRKAKAEGWQSVTIEALTDALQRAEKAILEANGGHWPVEVAHAA